MIKSNRWVLLSALLIWFILVLFHIYRTPIDHLSHDFGSHLSYTEVIIREHRLPKPYEDGGYPPLYYLINSVIAPESLKADKTFHIDWVRKLSALYGAMSILIFYWVLNVDSKTAPRLLLALLYIFTTPKFIFVFSTYNNDSLATLCGIAIVALSYKLYLKWSDLKALLLLVAAVAGLYTKYTIALPILGIMFLCIVQIGKSKRFCKTESKLILILLLSIMAILPWCLLHNYKDTKEFFPRHFELSSLKRIWTIDDNLKVLKVITRIPYVNSYPDEWEDPFAHTSWGYVNKSTKSFDYWAYSMVTSILDEYGFSYPGVANFWLLLCLHLLTYLLVLKNVIKSNIQRLSGILILLSHLGAIATIPFYIFSGFIMTPGFFEYRYICWNWIVWGALYIKALSESTLLSTMLVRIMFVSVILHLYILFTYVRLP